MVYFCVRLNAQKMFHRLFLYLPALLLLLASCSSGKNQHNHSNQQSPADTVVDDAIRRQLTDYVEQKQQADHLGFYVYDLTADKPVFGYREQAPMPPASCMKLISGVAAMHLLTDKYFYRTTLYTKGRILNGVLQGDVVLQGSLDPQLYAPDLAMFTNALKRRGIQEVEGNVFFAPVHDEVPTPEQHWGPGDVVLPQYGIFYQPRPTILRALRNALQRAGIKVDAARVGIGTVPHGARRIFRFSRQVGLVLGRAWHNSSNTQSSGILYTLGLESSPSASANPDRHDLRQRGVDYIHRFVREQLDSTGTNTIHDACGLCSENRVTAELLVKTLRYAYHHPDIFRMMRAHLPISGTSGSFRHMMERSTARGKIQAKTGTLTRPYGISTLSGFCRGRNGHLLAFAILNSQMSILDARPIQQRLCEIMIQ